MTVGGDHAYVVNEWGVQLFVVDVSSPAAPALVGSVELGSENWQWPVIIGDHVLIRNNSHDKVIAVDVSDPTAPFQNGLIDVVVGVGGLAAVRSWLLVPDAIDEDTPIVRIFDMRDPADLSEVSPYLPVGGFVGAVEVVGSVAYLSIPDIASYQSGAIEAVDFGNPLAPVFMNLQPRQGPVMRMASDKNAIFVFDRNSGFDTLALCQGPLFADGFESGDTNAWSSAVP